MKLSDAVSALLGDMQADQGGYARLRELLDAQFEAALAHSATRLTSLAQEIVGQVEQLDGRRARRAALLQRLAAPGEEASMSGLLQRLPQPVAERLTVSWQALEQQVRECKQINQRNCHLITEQQALMQRLLGRDQPSYGELSC
ncbi:MAG: flagellar protein FlgN [Burkholderiaceae bacterium]